MRSALFGCIIAAAVGCQSRNSRESPYGTPGTGLGAASETVHKSAAGNTVHETGAEGTPPVVGDQRVDRAGTVNQNTGAYVAPTGTPGAEARRTGTATRGTRMGSGTRYSAPATPSEGTSSRPAPPSGTLETSSGTGTTTNTGTDTDNAGTGNTTNPPR